MSLQVWLPLEKDINNYGHSSMKFSFIDSNYTGISENGVKHRCYRNTSFSGGGLVSDIPISLGQNQSMACWFKFSSLLSDSSLGGCMVNQHRYPNNTGMGLTIKYVSSTTGYLSVNTGNGSSRTFNTYCGTTLLQANTWYHGCYTYDGANIRIYVNGTLELTQAFTGMSVPSDYITVFGWSFANSSGNAVYGHYKLDGWLNDVRIYNHTLSQEEITTLAGRSTKGLQVWLPLTHDAKNQGLYHTNITTTSASLSTGGKLGKGYAFSGTANNVIKGTFPCYSTNTTWCIWAKFNAFNVHLLDCRTGDTAGDQPMYVTASSVQVGNGGSAFEDIPYSFSTGTWYHIAVCNTASTVKLYINGSYVGSTASAKGINYNGEKPFFIGSRFTGTNPFNGYVNDFRIYNYELSEQEIKEVSKGLMLHYQFNNRGHGMSNLVKYTNLFNAVQTEFKSYDVGVLDVANNEQVTISFDLHERVSTGGDGYLQVYNTNYPGPHQITAFNALSGRTLVAGQDIKERISGITTMTTRSSYTYDTDKIEFYSNYDTENEIEISNIKIERGSTATPYGDYDIHSLHYDKTVYIEPDGSKWVRVFYHNNPASALFASTDTFNSGVYKSSSCWYDIEYVLSEINSYEFMIKQKTTSDASEVKYRWVQNVNPLTATWDDVQPGKVVNNTNSGYTNGGMGGLWKMNSNTRMVIANASSGNWFGALGSWTAYSGGIPGYPNTAITTGYIELYVRIDNTLNIVPDTSGFGHNGEANQLPMTYSTNSNIYPVSTYFTGTLDAIQIPDLSVILSEGTFTFNIWFYKNQFGSKPWETILGGPSGFELEGKISSTSYAYIHPYSWGGGSTSTPNSYSIAYTFNEWHMLTMIRTPSYSKFYLDGQLKVTGTAGTIPSGNYYIGSWRDSTSQNYEGLLSDARIYAIELSADDILKLYNKQM